MLCHRSPSKRNGASSGQFVLSGVGRGPEALLNGAAMAKRAKKVSKKIGEDRRDLPDSKTQHQAMTIVQQAHAERREERARNGLA